MPLTNGISAVEVLYEDGSKEVYTAEDWTIYASRSLSPIPAKKPPVNMRSTVIQASREERC